MAQYLDFPGLSLYDELIKGIIKSGDDELISKINDIIGGDNVETSISDIVSLIGELRGEKSVAEYINELTEAITTLNGNDKTAGSVKSEVAALKKTHDEDIKHIKDYISELLGDSEIDGEGIASMSEINSAIKKLEIALGLEEGESEDVVSIMDRVDALENDVVYIPSKEIQDANLTSLKHEGLPATKATAFADRKYTYSEMFDMILFPTSLPVKSGPSVSFISSSVDVLVGDDITDYHIESGDGYLTYDLGTWTNNPGMTVSNGHNDPTFTFSNFGTAKNGKYTMGTKSATITASVDFLGGDTPKDNKGTEHPELAYTGGTVKATMTLKPYKNWYASTEKGGELTVQPVLSGCGISVKYTGDTSVNSVSAGTMLAAHKQGEEEQMFSVPTKITEFWQFNTFSNTWVQLTLEDGIPVGWELTQDSNNSYWTYTYKGPNNDPIYIILKF